MLIILTFIGGLLILVYGADRFVVGALGTAKYLGISSLLCGILIVGLATSLPEALVSASAAIEGSPLLGVANALGSNIANIGLVLGVTLLVSTNRLSSPPLGRDLVLMLLSMLAVCFVLIDRRLGLMDGIFLLILLVAVLLFMIYGSRSNIDHRVTVVKDHHKKLPVYWPIFNFFVGLACLVGGSKLLVLGAIDLARLWGLSETVIGLTIVAVGTSLPELAASLMSVIKGKSDMAVGNIIGSNIFNSLGVLAMPALLAPSFSLPPEILLRDVLCVVLIGAIQSTSRNSISGGKEKLGASNAGIAKTPKLLKILDPIIFPTAISLLPFITLINDAASSGRLVPTATIVSPMTVSLKPHNLARSIAPSTSNFDPPTRQARPTKKLKIGQYTGSFLWWSFTTVTL
jgi:cation:H+ antiporter